MQRIFGIFSVKLVDVLLPNGLIYQEILSTFFDQQGLKIISYTFGEDLMSYVGKCMLLTKFKIVEQFGTIADLNYVPNLPGKFKVLFQWHISISFSMQ